MTEYLVKGYNGVFYTSIESEEDIEAKCNEDGFCDEIVLSWNIVLDSEKDYETMVHTIANYMLEFFTLSEELLTKKLNKYITSDDTDLAKYVARFKDTFINEFESATEFVKALLTERIINEEDAKALFDECNNLFEYQFDIVSKLDLSEASFIIEENRKQQLARKKAVASKGSVGRTRRKNSK